MKLPADPRSPSYLIVCFVCKELAKPNQEHSLHYGGIVCLSCRAFFRRAHQKSKAPQFVCKNNNRCEVTVLNRRRCQKCRYDRCILAGMTPDAVLTEEERVIRFRKTLEKKKQRQVSGHSTNSNPESGGDQEEDFAMNEDIGVEDEVLSSEENPKDELEILLESINNRENKSIPASPRFDEMFDQFEQPDVLINTALPVLPKTNLISNFPKELPRLDDLISQEFGKDLLDPKFATTTSTATTTTTSRSSRFSIVDGSSENVFDSKMRSSAYRDPMRLGDINPGPVQSFQKKIINSFNAQQQQHLQQQQYLQQQQMNPYYKEKAETEKESHLKVETECRDLEELSFSLANPATPDQLAEPIGLTTLTGSSLLDSFDVEMETSPDDVLECSSRDVEESDCQLKALVQSYQMSVNQYSQRLTKNFLWILENGTKEVLSYIEQLTICFTNFASLQRSFKNLPKGDQDKLLARNTPIFIQFCFACDLLTSQSSREPFQNFFIQTGIRNIPEMESFFDWSQSKALRQMFRPGADLNYYSELLNSIASVKDVNSIRMKSVMSNAILFDVDDSLKLLRRDVIEEIQFENEKMHLRLLCGPKTVKFVLSGLSKMTVFAAYNISWAKPLTNTGLVCSKIVLPYTEEEESWLKDHLQLLDRAYHSVGWGEEITKEFMMYSLDVPVSKKFMKGVFNVELERLWRAYKMFPEFDKLPFHVQVDVMKRNSPAGLAVRVAEYESCQHGFQQVQGAFGAHEDEEEWKQNYGPIFQTSDSVKKMTMKHVASQRSVTLSQEQTLQFERLVKEFFDVVSDPIYYKLLTLMTLVKPVSSESASTLTPLRTLYENLLQRRTEWMFRSEQSRKKEKIFSRNRDPEMVTTKFFACLSHVDNLAGLLLYIKNQE